MVTDNTSKTIKLKDGRMLGYAEYGSSDGKPVFYFHGHPSSWLDWPLFDADDSATELNARIIAVDRPGTGLSDFKRVREILAWPDDVIELETIRYDPAPPEPDMGLFDTLVGILRKADPDAIPVPLLLTATTDAKHFSRLGIQTYGFTPMNLPKKFIFFETIHAADERIPVEAVNFGANAVYEALQLCGE